MCDTSLPCNRERFTHVTCSPKIETFRPHALPRSHRKLRGQFSFGVEKSSPSSRGTADRPLKDAGT